MLTRDSILTTLTGLQAAGTPRERLGEAVLKLRPEDLGGSRVLGSPGAPAPAGLQQSGAGLSLREGLGDKGPQPGRAQGMSPAPRGCARAERA